MTRLIAAQIVCALAALAQNTGVIRGVVLDAVTGQPVPAADLGASSGGKVVDAVANSDGTFVLRDVAPGRVEVSASTKLNGLRSFGPYVTRSVTLGPGQEVAGITLRLANLGEISGRVLDQNKEPVPGINVALIAPEYRYGVLRHAFGGGALTNDRGEYRLQSVEPGRAFLLVAQTMRRDLEAVSNAPADPKLRKRAIAPTFYPNSPTLDGALPVTLLPGEKREGVDFRLLRSPSLCLEATLDNGMGPAALRFDLEETEPHNGLSGRFGRFFAMPHGTAPANGKIRICELHPGQYKLIASGPPATPEATPFYGFVTVTLGKEDVRGVKVPGVPAPPLKGEVLWEGQAPEKAVSEKLAIQLRPPTRSGRSYPDKEEELDLHAAIPGEFTFPFVMMDEYEIVVTDIPPGIYVKDILYGTASVKQDVLHVGGMPASTALKLILRHDGGNVKAKVSDKDGKPVGGVNVIVMPQSTASDAQLAAAIVFGQTDQNGLYESPTLAPGKYLALAANLAVDRTPEMISRLSRIRNRATEIEIAAREASQVTLAPVGLDQ